jgi:hypothetical protein
MRPRIVKNIILLLGIVLISLTMLGLPLLADDDNDEQGEQEGPDPSVQVYAVALYPSADLTTVEIAISYSSLGSLGAKGGAAAGAAIGALFEGAGTTPGSIDLDLSRITDTLILTTALTSELPLGHCELTLYTEKDDRKCPSVRFPMIIDPPTPQQIQIFAVYKQGPFSTQSLAGDDFREWAVNRTVVSVP